MLFWKGLHKTHKGGNVNYFVVCILYMATGLGQCKGQNAEKLKTLVKQFPNPEEWVKAILTALGGDCPRNNSTVNHRNNGGTGVTSGSGGTPVTLTTTIKKQNFVASAFVTDSPSDTRYETGDKTAQYEGFEVRYAGTMKTEKPPNHSSQQLISVEIESNNKRKKIFHSNSKQIILNPPFPTGPELHVNIYQIKFKKKVNTITFKIPGTNKYMTINFTKKTNTNFKFISPDYTQVDTLSLKKADGYNKLNAFMNYVNGARLTTKLIALGTLGAFSGALTGSQNSRRTTKTASRTASRTTRVTKAKKAVKKRKLHRGVGGGLFEIRKSKKSGKYYKKYLQ